MDAMSCLAPPPQAPFLSASSSLGPAYYTDAALARALNFSAMPEYEYDYSPAASSPSNSALSSSSLLADFPCGTGGSNWFASTSAPPTGSLACDSVLVASDAAPRPPSTPVAVGAAANKRRAGLGPNAAGAGRAGKRRARASKRAPTTYISTDPANFRLMVQHVTGVQSEPGTDDGSVVLHASFDASSAAALLDCHPFGDALRLPSDADAAALHRHHQQQLVQQQQPCYPTLDSWSVMYESSQLL
ncbi:calmodulin-binding protein 25-like [Triticum dicoccoides]|uniref:calmodulin-binding protein 25-like n=1 Tax=Triticum dicoccoides TaxID=85692 RepID=UPI00188F8436|nr:calmodulin-binding protein 25-like [Triticum dicoccoides]